MSVAVTLPKNVIGIQIAAKVARVGHILVIFLLDEYAHVSFQVHFQNAVGFVSTLIKLEREGFSVLVPVGSCHLILRGKQGCAFGTDGSFSCYIYHDGYAIVQ